MRDVTPVDSQMASRTPRGPPAAAVGIAEREAIVLLLVAEERDLDRQPGLGTEDSPHVVARALHLPLRAERDRAVHRRVQHHLEPGEDPHVVDARTPAIGGFSIDPLALHLPQTQVYLLRFRRRDPFEILAHPTRVELAAIVDRVPKAAHLVLRRALRQERRLLGRHPHALDERVVQRLRDVRILAALESLERFLGREPGVLPAHVPQRRARA